MTKLNKTQIASINSLTVFETAEDRFGRSQAEIFGSDAAKLRKTVQFVIAAIGKSTGAKRDAILKDLGLAWLASHSKKRDILSAWAKFAGEMGAQIVAKAKTGKLGKCSTIRGAVASHDADNKPKATRKPNSGQGKTGLKSPAKKQVAFTAKQKADWAKASVGKRLEWLEQNAPFDVTQFFADWTAEANEGNATLTGKIAANG